MKEIVFGVSLAIIALLGTTLVVNKINHNAQVTELRNEIELLSTENATLIKDRETILKLIEEIEAGIKVDKATIASLQEDVLRLEAELATALHSNNVKENIIKMLMSNIEEHKTKIAALNAEIKTQLEKLAHNQLAAANMQARIDVLESKIVRFTTILNSNEVRITELKTEISVLKKELAQEKADRNADLTAIYNRLEELNCTFFKVCA